MPGERSRAHTRLLEEDVAGQGGQQQGHGEPVARQPQGAAHARRRGARGEVVQRAERVPEQAQPLPLRRQVLPHLRTRRQLPLVISWCSHMPYSSQ